MLRIDFYESGQGETILVRFPDGGIGVVDAHPSRSKLRPEIEVLVGGQRLHFLCLTHPHADHGVDLFKAIKAAAQVDRYWHTVTDIQTLFYAVTQQRVFPARFSPLLTELRIPWAEYLIDLYDEVKNRTDADPEFTQRINNQRRSDEIAGVTVHFLGPLEADQNHFTSTYRSLVEGKHRNKPNENTLSAILAFEYGGHLVLLGSDALAENWVAAEMRCRKEELPKAVVLKVPHHGGQDALGHYHGKNYLDLCRPNRETKAILFGGDAKHPHPKVLDRLNAKVTVQCLANGLKPPGQMAANPLGLNISGARALVPAPTCNPHIGFTIHGDGRVEQTAGAQCEFCGCR
jgi:beta-lactamase superfamily II metal-dependent hydrolase